MPSLRKSQAARVNGAKSHGPKTAEGKQKSSMNALRHGLTAATVVLTNESDSRFKMVFDAYLEHFQPVGNVEMDLVEEMAVAKWRQRRLWGIETAQLDLQMDRQEEKLKEEFEKTDEVTNTAIAFQKLGDESNILSLMHRYETRMCRNYDRALKSLLLLQQLRKSENKSVRSTTSGPQLVVRNEPTKPPLEGPSVPAANQSRSPDIPKK